MCGIAGVIGSTEEAVRHALEAMLKAQGHRGPDDGGIEIARVGDRVLGLGQRRLSIVDLSPAGHQPMLHPETGDAIVFGGEIYECDRERHALEQEGTRFKGHSDTEVLLHSLSRWGEEHVGRLNGIFTFAFFSRRRGTLLLARDPMGIRPLYVALTPDGMLFANEVRAIVATGLVSKDVDPQSVASLLAYGSVAQPGTIYRSVRSFPAGCRTTIRIGEPPHRAVDSPTRFWSFPAPSRQTKPQELAEQVEDCLEQSVTSELVADVPLGVFLSSGIDSTIVTTLAAKHMSRVRAFTVDFPDFPDASEVTGAAETARAIGVEHVVVPISSQDAQNSFVGWLDSMDQPSCDGLNTYIVTGAAKKAGAGVVLSGLGGDELFGGYATYRDVPRLYSAFRGAFGALPRFVRSAAFAVASARKHDVWKMRAADMARSDGSLLDLYLHRRRLLSNVQMNRLGLVAGEGGLSKNYLPEGGLADVTVDDKDVVGTVRQLESRLYMGNRLLRDGDVLSMAWSLEVRVPMLNRRIMDLAMTVPGDVLLPDRRNNKHLLVKAFAKALRPAQVRAPKRGFTLPLARWMSGPLRGLCQDSLDRLKSLSLLRPEGIDHLWASFLRRPDSPLWERVIALVALERVVTRAAA